MAPSGEVDNAIGRRLREIRSWRGLSLMVTAELAGLSKAYLSRIERGERPVQRRAALESLAQALQVALSEITGQPYPPGDQTEAVGHGAVPMLRGVLRDIELGVPVVEALPRPLAALRPEVAAINTAAAASDYATLGETVPGLLGELHALASWGRADPRSAGAARAHPARGVLPREGSRPRGSGVGGGRAPAPQRASSR